jgi:hypothetical protein
VGSRKHFSRLVSCLCDSVSMTTITKEAILVPNYALDVRLAVSGFSQDSEVRIEASELDGWTGR